MNNKKTMKLALEALQNPWKAGPDGVADAIIAIKEALAQLEQEPVQYKCTVVDNQHPSGIPLEQWAKPQRTWVDLTDDEIQVIAKKARSKDHAVTLTNKFLRDKNT